MFDARPGSPGRRAEGSPGLACWLAGLAGGPCDPMGPIGPMGPKGPMGPQGAQGGPWGPWIIKNIKNMVDVKNCQKIEFLGMGFPGVENDATPRGIILHPFPASQLPYRPKIRKFRIFGQMFPNFPIYPLVRVTLG